MRKYFQLAKQVILYGLVGVGSLLIDLAVTTTLYNHAHLPAYLAGCIGFLSAFFFNFPINRKHVFNHTVNDKFSLRLQVTMYISLSLFNLMMTGVMLQLLVHSGLLNIAVAKLCVTALIAVWNFLLFKFVIFAKRPPDLGLESLIVQ